MKVIVQAVNETWIGQYTPESKPNEYYHLNPPLRELRNCLVRAYSILGHIIYICRLEEEYSSLNYEEL